VFDLGNGWNSNLNAGSSSISVWTHSNPNYFGLLGQAQISSKIMCIDILQHCWGSWRCPGSTRFDDYIIQKMEKVLWNIWLIFRFNIWTQGFQPDTKLSGQAVR
jgi:hypothetical protein